VTFRQFLGILRARWRLVAGIFGGVLLATVIITVLVPRQYEADATVVVDVKADPTTGAINPDQLLTSYLATQVDIASSDRVARRVVKELKLDADPERRAKWVSKTGGNGDYIEWIAQLLRKKVNVMPARDSSVITIAATYDDRKTAARVANAFAQAYVNTAIDLKVEPAKQYAGWFAERSRALQVELEARQKRLSDYQAATGITATDERLDIENARLAELSAAVTRSQQDYQKNGSKLSHDAGNAESVPEVLQSPLIAGLKSDLALAESKLQDLSTRTGTNHPDYLAAEAQVVSLRSRISEETTKVLSSLNNDTQRSLQQQVEGRAALEAQKRRILEVRHEHDQVQVLQNDVIAAQRALDDVTQRLSQNNLQSQLQQTNILQLTEAVEPPVPSSPIIRLNLAVGFFLAVLLAVGAALVLELRNPPVRSTEDLARVLVIPLLGSVRSGGKVSARGSAAPSGLESQAA
jgi:chain length determinant protein EpsF